MLFSGQSMSPTELQRNKIWRRNKNSRVGFNSLPKCVKQMEVPSIKEGPAVLCRSSVEDVSILVTSESPVM